MSATKEANVELVLEFQRLAKAGENIRARNLADKIVRGNEGLARKFAIKYGHASSEEDREDNMQAARMGVLRAAQDFDPASGSFSTYAHNHIRDFVQRWSGKFVSVAKPRGWSMPRDVAQQMAKHRALHGKEPEAALLYKTDPEGKLVRVKEEELKKWQQASLITFLDQTNEEGSLVQDFLTEEEDSVETAMAYKQLSKSCKEALANLSPRDLKVANRLVWEGGSVTDIALEEGLPEKRIREIQTRILNRLRCAFIREEQPPSSRPLLAEPAVGIS